MTSPLFPSRLALIGPALLLLACPVLADDPEKPQQETAQLVVRILPDARLHIEGAEVKKRGEVRRFETPPLTRGFRYSYTLKATWDENGKEATREAKVSIQPGQTVEVDLRPETKPAAVETPAPVKKPASSLTLGPLPAVSVVPGGEAKVSIPVKAGGIDKPIQVSFAGLPAGVTIKPVTVLPAPGDTTFEATAVVLAAADARPGQAPIKVTAQSAETRAEQEFKLTVKEAVRLQTVRLTLEVPASLEVEAGSKVPVPVKIVRSGYAGPVNVKLQGVPMPGGGSAATIPTGKDEVGVELAVTRETREGKYQVNVVASAEGSSAAAPIHLTVKPPPPAKSTSASLTLRMPSTLHLQIGGFAKLLPITVQRKGYDGPVMIKFEKVPPGVVFGPATIPPGMNRVEVEASVSTEAEPGEYETRVTGRSDQASAEFLLKIKITTR